MNPFSLVSEFRKRLERLSLRSLRADGISMRTKSASAMVCGLE
jgi:hypothetical protein